MVPITQAADKTQAERACERLYADYSDAQIECCTLPDGDAWEYYKAITATAYAEFDAAWNALPGGEQPK